MAEPASDWGAAWGAEGLRRRLAPRNRLASSLFQAVPWIDAVLAALFAYIACNRFIFTPSVNFSLPPADAVTEWSAEDPTIVMLRKNGPDGPVTLVFHDGVRYEISSEAETRKLEKSLGSGRSGTAGGEILLLAEESVPHGDVVRLVDIARKGGFTRVCVSVKPE